MRRAGNPWDRFYRYHEAPWRGARSVDELRPWLDGRILEVGCGNGKGLLPLQQAGFDAVGLDISWHALRRLGQGVLADVEALPFCDDAFGTVLDIHCTGHLPPAARTHAIAEIARVGRTVIVERLGTKDLRATGGNPAQLADGRETWFSSLDRLADELVDAGLKIIDRHQFDRQLRLRGRMVDRQSVRVVASRP